MSFRRFPLVSMSPLRARMLAVAVLFCSGSVLRASTYADASDFFAAADVELTADFEGIAAPDGSVIYWDELVVNDRLTLSQAYGHVYGKSYYLTPSDVFITPNPLTLNFEEGVTAVGFEYGLLSGIPGSGDVTIAAYDAVTGGTAVFSETFAAANVYAGWGSFSYFGIEGVGQIRRMEITGTSGFSVVLDNISLSAIPEPAAFAAFAGLSVLGLAAARRNRRL